MDDPFPRHHGLDILFQMESEQVPQPELQPCPEPDPNGRRRQPPVWFSLPLLCICLFQVTVLVPQIAHLNIGSGRFSAYRTIRTTPTPPDSTAPFPVRPVILRT
ncbi:MULTISPECIES: hypothetical protein [Gluconobacter]|uniref:hypothetical protein n=1 Tax=Gluconobacter TaxID=441 RepID=UPI0039EB37CB